MEVRNIGILAHVDAGKTSITEKILYLAGLKRETGTVDEGTTATDFLSVEKRHGITVKSAAVRFEWGGRTVHLIDTPGHVDFGHEVDRAIRILDGAIIAVCAVSGVQARTEVIAQASAKRSLSRVYFVNKMDRPGADFFGVIDELRTVLEPHAVAVQCPIIEGRKWVGIVDLVTMKARRFDSAPGQTEPAETIPNALESRASLLERLAEIDERILDLYAADKAVSVPMIQEALARGVLSCAICPVFCGSAFVDESIALLLDGATELLPSPEAAGIPEGIDPRTGNPAEMHVSPEAPLAAFVFKTVGDASGEVVAWTRIWSGTLRSGKKVLEVRTGKEISIRKLFGIHADSLEECAQAVAGQIVAVKAVGKFIEPGASLCDRGSPVLFEALELPEPVVSLAVEPATREDLEPLRKGLEMLAVEDRALHVTEEKETGRFMIAGQGELHLDIVAERLRRDFGLKFRTGNPRVNLRERLLGPSEWKEDFDHDFGGERVRVSVTVRLEPRTALQADLPSFVSPGLRIAPQFLAAARRGAESAMSAGPLQGWPLEETIITLLELQVPGAGTGRNGELAVEAASATAVRKAILAAGAKLLEPVMILDIECPEEYFGAVLGSLSSRSGRVESVEDGLSVKTLLARAPMRNLFGFAGEIRSMSKGRAHFQARFGSYEPVRQPFEP
jgi:elongation factor G